MNRNWLSSLFKSCKRPKSKPAPRRRFRPGLEQLEARCTPATITVNSALDTPVGGGMDLREALQQAGLDYSAGNGADQIVFDPSLNGSTIHLTGGPLAINFNVTIAGPGAGELTIDGGGTAQVFNITSGNVSISGLQLADGMAAQGGAIYNAGNLQLDNDVLAANVAQGANGTPVTNAATTNNQGGGPGEGGAVYDAGTLTVHACTLTDNEAIGGTGGVSLSGSTLPQWSTGGGGAGMGGAIFIVSGASAQVTDSTFDANTAQGGNGGGFPASFGTTATDETGGGGAGLGGALFDDAGTVTATNNTFYGNQALGGDGGNSHTNADGGNGAIAATGVFGQGGGGGQQGGNGGFGGGGGGGLFNAGHGGFGGGNGAGGGGSGSGPLGSGGDGYGGAIFTVASVSIQMTNDTLAENQAGGGAGGTGLAGHLGSAGTSLGGGIYVDPKDASGAAASPSVALLNVLIAGNSAAGGSDIEGTIVSQGTNLIGNASGAGGLQTSDLTGVNPQLDPTGLQDNGGLTETVALEYNSPAIDAGNATGAPATDQRGQERVGAPDIGAYEFPGVTATANSYVVAQGGALTVSAAQGLLTNDEAPTGDPLTAVAKTTPVSAASFQVNADGSFTYTPVAGFSGTDSFQYTISDYNHHTSTATVLLDVIAPTVSYAAVTATLLSASAANGVLAGEIAAAALLGIPPTFTVSLVTGPTHTSGFTFNADGSFTYKSAPAYHGVDGFTFRVTDGNGNTAQSSVYLNVSPSANVFLVTTTADQAAATAGELRWAINQANADPGSTIAFDIGTQGSSQTIFVATALPTISTGVLIDGWSQGGPSYTGAPLITIDGTHLAAGNGLTVAADDVQVSGLDIQNFAGYGLGLIQTSSESDDWVYGNYLVDNTGSGLFVASGANGNLIGTNGDGIADSAERNVISGNQQYGISLNSANNVVAGNYLGIAADGQTAEPNAQYGMFVAGGSNLIGGTGADAGNVISGNTGAGLMIVSAGNTVQGNLIGTDAAGNAPLENGAQGILVSSKLATSPASNNLIGGTAAGAGNVIAANGNNGLQFNGAFVFGNLAEGNCIGTNAAGDAGLGNADNGVAFSQGAHDNTLGGTAAGAGNVITGNGTASSPPNLSGVALYNSNTIDNRISGNSIYGNNGLGIDIFDNGVSLNDSDPHTTASPNLAQNFPILTGAISVNGVIAITGTLEGAASTTYSIEFFGNPAPDPSGYGEGKVYLGAASVTTDATGNVTFSVQLTGTLATHEWVSSTATDPSGNTSEFSKDVESDNPPHAVNDLYQMNQGTVLSIPAAVGVLANDSDPDGDTLTATPATGGAPQHGSLTLNADGSFTYTPVPGFSGTDSFIYLAADGLGGSATGTVVILVNPEPAQRLAFSVQPTGGIAGTALTSIQVEELNPLGSVETGDNSTIISMTVASGPGSLSGTVTATVSGGVATFSNLMLNTAGAYTLTASSGTLTSATSTSFTVTPGAVSHLVLLTAPPSSVAAGTAFGLQVAAEDANNNIVTGVSGSATLSLNSGPGGGVLSPASPSAAFVNGVATFSGLSLNKANAGTAYVLRVSGASKTVNTGNIFVTPGVATQLVLSTVSTLVTAGSAFTVTATAEDSQGNTVTTFGGTASVILAGNPGGSTLGGTTSVTFSNGVATFNTLTLNIADSGYQLQVSGGSLGALTNTVAVQSALATHFAVTTSTATPTAGTAFDLTLTALDQFGNVATGYVGQVAITSSDSGTGVALPALYTFTSGAGQDNGTHTFSSGVTLVTAGPQTVTATDTYSSSIIGAANITVQAAAVNHLVFGQQPGSTTAASTIAPAVTVLIEDRYNNVTTSSASVSLVVGGSPGTLLGTTTVTAINGVATFSNLLIDKASSFTLTATSGAMSLVSNSFTVAPTPAQRLFFSVQPANGTAGTALASVQVQELDQFGDVETADNSTVISMTGASGGSLGGTVTATVSGGMATFSNLVLDTAGSYTLTASSGTLVDATSSGFTVVPGAVSQLVLLTAPPSSVAAGTSFGLQVAAEDANNNIVTGVSGSATLSLNSGPGGGALSPASPSATFVNGVATFSGLSLNKANAGMPYTFQVSGAGHAVNTGNIFVTPGVATQLVLSTVSTPVTAGSAFTVTATAEDSQGNTVTTFGGTASVILAGNPGGSTLGGTTSVTFSNGVATFNTLTLNIADSGYQLQVSGGSLGALTNTVAVQSALATHFAVTTSTATPTAGTAFDLTLTALDQFGNVATGYVGQVAITSSDSGTGVALPALYTFTSGAGQDNGTHTFSSGVTLVTAGPQTVTATDTYSSSIIGAANITVQAAAVNHLVFGQQPGSTTAASTIAPAVTVLIEDRYNNVTTSSASVSLVVGGSPGTLLGTTTVTAINGVATFSNLLIDKASSFTLTATSGAMSLVSNSFTVAPTPAQRLFFSVQPANGTAGTALASVQVQELDQFGDVETGDNSTVISMTVAIGPGSLTGTVTATVSGGVATFSDLVLDTAGNYALTASSGTLVNTTSSSITVTAGVASSITVLTGSPQSATVDTTFATPVTALVTDSLGNPVSGASVTFAALGSGAGGVFLGSGTATEFDLTNASGVATASMFTANSVAGSYTVTVSTAGASPSASIGLTNLAGTADHLVFVQQPPTNATAGVTLGTPVTVDVVDLDGNLVNTGASVTLASAGGPGSLLGTTTVNAAGGVATFNNLSIQKAGTYTFTAGSGGLGTGSSGPITVSAATASNVTVSAGAGQSGTVNTAFAAPIVVTVTDAFGNPVQGATVSFASPGSGAGAGFSTPAATNASGQTQTTATADTIAGAYTNTVTVTSGGSGSSDFSLTNTAGAATSVSVTSGGSQSAAINAAFASPIVVTVTDAFGNPVQGATLSFVGPGTGAGAGFSTPAATNASGQTQTTATANAAVGGPYGNSVSVTSGGTGSTTFLLTNSVGASFKLAFSQAPSSGVDGAVISPAVTVQVEDQAGNVVNDAGVSVTLAIGANPGGGSIGGTITETTNSAGIATFSNLTISQTGIGYTLTAGSGTLIGATSPTFNEVVATEVFVIGTDQGIYDQKFASNGNPTTGFAQTAAGQAISLAVGHTSAGQLELFVIGTNNQVYYQLFDSAGDPTTGFIALPGYARALAVGKLANGDSELFVIGTNHQIYYMQLNADGTPTTDVFEVNSQNATGFATAIAVGSYMNDVSGTPTPAPEVFVVGTDTKIYCQLLSTSGTNSVTGGATNFTLTNTLVPGHGLALAVGQLPSGAPELFAIGTNTEIYYQLFNPDGTPLTNFALTAPAQTGYGRALNVIETSGGPELFVIGTDYGIYYQLFDATDGSPSATTPTFVQTAPGTGAYAVGLASAYYDQGLNAAPELFVIGTNTEIYDQLFLTDGTPFTTRFTQTAPGFAVALAAGNDPVTEAVANALAANAATLADLDAYFAYNPLASRQG